MNRRPGIAWPGPAEPSHTHESRKANPGHAASQAKLGLPEMRWARSAKHLPGFVQHADAIKAKGVDTIACISVNDAFVMGAWGQDQNVSDKVLMLADGSGKFAEAAGLVLDLTDKGLGVRNQRFSMIVDNGVVQSIHVDEGTFEKTSAEQMLSELS